MLVLASRKGSPFWYVRGSYCGHHIYASTKTSDKASARRLKEALEIRLSRAGQSHALTFSEAATLYLEARPASPQWLADINRLCAVIGDRLLDDIKQHVLVDAASSLYPHCQASSKNRSVFGPAAAILHYAASNELCSYRRISRLKEKRPEPRAMRKEDAARLIAAADGKLKLLLVFLFCQGWRISDVLRLQWTDIDLAEGLVRYHMSKSDRWMTTALHITVITMLSHEAIQTGHIFPWAHRSSVSRLLGPLCRQCGIKFTCHQARHSFASWLNAEGASTKEIMEAGAWADMRSVLRYTNVDATRVRLTINKIKFF
jgi:integrase/recombinase XerD